MLFTFITLVPLIANAARVTPSGNYTPTLTSCPVDHQFVRPASSGLNPQESAWLKNRKCNAASALKDYLCSVDIPGFDSEAYYWAIKDNTENSPTLALTFSGGGTRAQIAGYGIYQGLDGRHEPSVQAGTGGLLQAMTYIVGLSGGAIGATSLAISEFPTIEELVQAGNVNATAPDEAFNELIGKAMLGFPPTFADVLAVLQSYHALVNIKDPDVNQYSWTYSGIQEQTGFQNGSVPMFILMLNEVVPYGPGSNPYQTPNGTVLLADDNSVTYYEITPFEFGSWTGRIKAFTDLQYWGTTLQNGQPVSDCVLGYDSAAFSMGTALSAVNLWFAEYFSNGTVGQFAKREAYPLNEDAIEQMKVMQETASIVEMLPSIAQLLRSNVTDILYALVPNSFANYTDGVEAAAGQQEYLFLADGSEAGQENPIWPVIQPARTADLIIVSDNGGTELSTGWANGTTFRNTYLAAKTAGLPFPEIPSVRTLINLNYTSRPTFFGCNEPDVPLVLWVADYPYTAYTNITFTEVALNASQVSLLTANGASAISQDGGKLAENWPQCLACASVYRSLERMRWAIPDACDACMRDYCWQGQTDESEPSFLDPTLRLDPLLGYEEWNATVFY